MYARLETRTIGGGGTYTVIHFFAEGADASLSGEEAENSAGCSSVASTFSVKEFWLSNARLTVETAVISAATITAFILRTYSRLFFILFTWLTLFQGTRYYFQGRFGKGVRVYSLEEINTIVYILYI